MAAHWPGGKQNSEKGIKGWIRCHAQLRVWLSQMSPEEKTKESNERKQHLMDALADTPEIVELSDTDPESGERRHLTVYAKNDIAMRAAHWRNMQIALLLDGTAVLQERGLTVEDAELIGRAIEEVSYLQRCIAWIYTTPGARAPFTLSDPRPQPPAEYDNLASADFYLLAAAAQRVNVQRLTCLEHSQSSATAPDWPGYWSGLAAEFHTSTAQLMGGDHSVISLVVASAERARAEREAMERAKSKAKART